MLETITLQHTSPVAARPYPLRRVYHTAKTHSRLVALQSQVVAVRPHK